MGVRLLAIRTGRPAPPGIDFPYKATALSTTTP